MNCDNNNFDKPLFSFGLITDIQYADIDDGWDYHKITARHYRNSLTLLQNAVEDWKQKGEISFVTQLGDIIDGLNKQSSLSEISLKKVLDQFLDYQVHHLVGNHELYNFGRAKLKETPLNHSYYHFSPHPHWRFILLDGFEFSTIVPETRESALEYLKQNNPNRADGEKDIHGTHLRFMPFNGAVSESQLEWLKQVLDESDNAGQKVIILSHVPLGPGACNPKNLLWNYDKVLEILYSKQNCVQAVMAGHDHKGGFHRDSHGIYHCTFPAVLEAPLGQNAHCTVNVYSHKIDIKGNGIIKDDVWLLKQ